MAGLSLTSPTIAVTAIFVVLLTVGGLGYAACTGGLGVGPGKSGSVSIEWASPSSTSVSASYVRCSSTFTASVLQLTVSNLAPGASCALSATLKNVGTLPASLDSEFSVLEPRGCPYFAYSDNVHGLLTDPKLAAGGTFSYHATFSLAPQAGNPCEGKVSNVQVTVTGSAQ
jgi:hypothetical protein